MKAFIEHIKSMRHGDRQASLLWLVADVLSMIVMGVGVATASGYIFKVELAYRGWMVGSPAMSFQTGLCFSIVGLLLLTSHRNLGK